MMQAAPAASPVLEGKPCGAAPGPGPQHHSSRSAGGASAGLTRRQGRAWWLSRSAMESESVFLTKADAAGRGTNFTNGGLRENILRFS